MTPEPACRPTKTCTTCGETKPLTDFHRHAKSPQGRRSSCKECVRAQERARHHARTPQEVERKRAYDRARRAKKRAHTRKDDDIALTGGRWVAGPGGVRRWVA